MSIYIDKKIIEYFEKNINFLKNNYKWKIPNVDGFTEKDNSSYISNKRFKNFLKKEFFKKKEIEHQVNVAIIIIKKWGGINSIHHKTIISFLEKYFLERYLPLEEKTLPHKCVSSYSKLYSIIQPTDYAIYDSRVAACLNALQINLNISDGYVFNYVNGRNNIIGNNIKKIGFTQKIENKEENIKIDYGWERIKIKENYKFYLKYLGKIKDQLNFECELCDLEMILFSDAEHQCKVKMNI